MQLKINISTQNSITLPINYHYIQQGIIYSLLSDDTGIAAVHDEGARFQDKEFRLFTYGPFQGKYSIRDKKITFQEGLSFEIRSFDENAIRRIDSNVHRRGIRLGKSIYRDIETELMDYRIYSEDVVIKMISPICVYDTDSVTGRTNYYTPRDFQFGELIISNFMNKYIAAIGEGPEGELGFDILKIGPKDKYITRYKNFLIEGWKGIYNLSGTPELMTFLYNAGLGAKNSQGFGMFEVIS